MKFTFEICVGTLPSIRTERCKIDIKEQLLYRDLFFTEHLQSYLTRTLINLMFCYWLANLHWLAGPTNLVVMTYEIG